MGGPGIISNPFTESGFMGSMKFASLFPVYYHSCLSINALINFPQFFFTYNLV